MFLSRLRGRFGFGSGSVHLSSKLELQTAQRRNNITVKADDIQFLVPLLISFITDIMLFVGARPSSTPSFFSSLKSREHHAQAREWGRRSILVAF